MSSFHPHLPASPLPPSYLLGLACAQHPSAALSLSAEKVRLTTRTVTYCYCGMLSCLDVPGHGIPACLSEPLLAELKRTRWPVCVMHPPKSKTLIDLAFWCTALRCNTAPMERWGIRPCVLGHVAHVEEVVFLRMIVRPNSPLVLCCVVPLVLLYVQAVHQRSGMHAMHYLVLYHNKKNDGYNHLAKLTSDLMAWAGASPHVLVFAMRT